MAYSELKATETLQAQETLLPHLLNYLEECKLGAWPTIRVSTKNDFLPTYLAGRTNNVLSLSDPLKPPGALPPPELRMPCAQQFPFLSLNLSGMRDSHTHARS